MAAGGTKVPVEDRGLTPSQLPSSSRRVLEFILEWKQHRVPAQSYFESVASERQPPIWYLSHTWSLPMPAVVKAVHEHARLRGLSAKSSPYWDAAFAINWKDHEAELGMRNSAQESVLKRVMQRCDGLLAVVMAPLSPKELKEIASEYTADQKARHEPGYFSRPWCCFEAFLAVSETAVKVDVGCTLQGAAAVVLEGFSHDESKLIDEDGPRIAFRNKENREGAFPVSILKDGMEVSIAAVKAGVAGPDPTSFDPGFRSWILNSISQAANLKADPVGECDFYEDLNQKLRVRFAELAWRQAIASGSEETTVAVEKAIRDCRGLQKLSMNFRFLRGNVKDEQVTSLITSICGLREVRALVLDFCNCDLTAGSFMKLRYTLLFLHLETFELYLGPMKGVLTLQELRLLDNVTRLGVYQQVISGVFTDLIPLRQLKTLRLCSCSWDTAKNLEEARIGELVQLEELVLKKCKFDGELNHFEKLTNLRRLELVDEAEASKVVSGDISVLAKLLELQEVCINCALVQGRIEELAPLGQRLLHLDLRRTQVCGSAEVLTSFSQLRKVFLKHCKVESASSDLKKRLNLQESDLDDTDETADDSDLQMILWDTFNPEARQIQVDGYTLRCQPMTSDFVNVLTKAPIESGRHYFEFIMHHIGDEQIAGVTHDPSQRGSGKGIRELKGWYYYSGRVTRKNASDLKDGHGSLHELGQAKKSFQTLKKEGDVIGMLVDKDRGKLVFGLNGKLQGGCDIPESVRSLHLQTHVDTKQDCVELRKPSIGQAPSGMMALLDADEVTAKEIESALAAQEPKQSEASSEDDDSDDSDDSY